MQKLDDTSHREIDCTSLGPIRADWHTTTRMSNAEDCNLSQFDKSRHNVINTQVANKTTHKRQQSHENATHENSREGRLSELSGFGSMTVHSDDSQQKGDGDTGMVLTTRLLTFSRVHRGIKYASSIWVDQML
jgi:hypothetical protein